MWLHDFARRRPGTAVPREAAEGKARRLAVLALGLVLVAGALPACTVRPLYADAAMLPGSRAEPAAGVPSIILAPVGTRDAQQVRNQLIFLLNGGAGQPASARYTVTLNVLSVVQASASIQVVTDEEPTAASVSMSSTYIITDNQTGKPVAQGRREILSAYDVPRQEFAVLRATIDAQNRAARELAELLKLSIIQSLERLEQTPVALK